MERVNSSQSSGRSSIGRGDGLGGGFCGFGMLANDMSIRGKRQALFLPSSPFHRFGPERTAEGRRT
jgi:hypothetical protein